MNSLFSAHVSGNRVAPAHAAAPSAAVLHRRLLPARQQPARASFSRRCLCACGKVKNTLLPVRSGNHPSVRFLANALAPARAFVRAGKGTVGASSGRGNPRGCRTVFFTPGAVSRRLTFARARLPVPSRSSSPNPPVEGSARKQGLRVPSALRAPAPPHLARWGFQ